MGYTTDFEGRFNFNRTVTDAERAYLTAFADTRRMGRFEHKAANLPDPLREAVGLPLGSQAEFYVGDEKARENFGQNDDDAVIDHNRPPQTQPGLWCQWEITEDGNGLEWNGTEKFYNYVEWLTYMIDNFFSKWGIILNGTVRYQGEDSSDRGSIIVNDNIVFA